MELFKITHFERDHGAGTFVRFRHLSKEESLAVVQQLWARLKLQGEVDAQRLVRAIWKAAKPVHEIGDAEEDFCLDDLLRRLGFSATGSVFLDWRRFEDVDEVLTEDFCRQFSDIWYPSSDDLDIVDSELRWILTVSHCGLISGIRLQ
jgi:hypothetical protein